MATSITALRIDWQLGESGQTFRLCASVSEKMMEAKKCQKVVAANEGTNSSEDELVPVAAAAYKKATKVSVATQ